MKQAWCAVLLGCVACGGGGAEQPDAGPPDAAPIDAVSPALGRYVVTAIDLPTDSTEADAFGVDLDGDGTRDNQLGNIFSAMVAAAGTGTFDPQATVDASIASGDLILLIAGVPCDDDGCVSTFEGTDLGAGLLGIADGTPTDEVVTGATTDGVYTGGPGSLILGLTFPGSPPVFVDLVRARASLTLDGFDLGTPSTIGGGVPRSEVEERMIPGWHAGVAAQIAADCGDPAGVGACMCLDGSTGSTYLGIFDDNADCSVPIDEFRDSALVTTLFRPDLDSDGDGELDALSVGVGITAEAALFDLP